MLLLENKGLKMPTMTEPVLDVRRAILQRLENGECGALSLLSELAKQGYLAYEVKSALSDLMSDGKVELTPDRVLKCAPERAA
jgi:hypothetical protein